MRWLDKIMLPLQLAGRVVVLAVGSEAGLFALRDRLPGAEVDADLVILRPILTKRQLIVRCSSNEELEALRRGAPDFFDVISHVVWEQPCK